MMTNTETIFPLLFGLPGQEIPDALLFSLQSGLMVTSAVHAAVQLGLADHMETPKRLDDLAQETHTHAPSLVLLLRALAGIGIFEELEQALVPTFLNTERSRLLKSDAMADLVRLWGADYQWDAWKQLVFTIQTGKPALLKTSGEANIWTYLTAHPEERLTFQRGLTAVSNLVLPAILSAYDFSQVQQVVDVGGGHGALLFSLLKRYPHLNGMLFDRRLVLEQIPPETIQALPAQVVARYSQMDGDFFEEVPMGADCYVLKNILMDWSDENALELLHTCRQVMTPRSGRLLVIEPVLGKQTPFTRFFSLQMAMLMRAARHRTLEEHRALFQEAGFDMTEASHLGLEQMLLVGTPVERRERGVNA